MYSDQGVQDQGLQYLFTESLNSEEYIQIKNLDATWKAPYDSDHPT